MADESFISELVGGGYPPAVPVGGRLRRDWIIRTVGSLPSPDALSQLAEKLESTAAQRIAEAYSASADGHALDAARPLVRLIRLNDNHLVARIEFAEKSRSVGDSAAISQWGVLESLDRVARFDDLQGLPADLWFPIRAAREAR